MRNTTATPNSNFDNKSAHLLATFGLDSSSAFVLFPCRGGFFMISHFLVTKDAIASSRPDLTHDAAFLSRVSARSVDLLAKLLSALCPDINRWEPKRRKIQCERQKTLWSGRQVRLDWRNHQGLIEFPTRGGDDLPTWSTSGSTEEEPRLP